MEMMDGDLHHLNKNHNITLSKKYMLLKKIFEDVYKLYTLELYFTDIKVINVLYKIHNDDIIIKFCDFGGIVTIKDDGTVEKALTYQYFEDDREESIEQLLIHHLCILVISFINKDRLKGIERISLNDLYSDIDKDIIELIKTSIKFIYNDKNSKEDVSNYYISFTNKFIELLNEKK